MLGIDTMRPAPVATGREPPNDRLGGTIEEENTPSATWPQENTSEDICGNCGETLQLRKHTAQRQRLPNRRESENFSFELNGLRFLSIEPLLEDLGPLDLKGIGWCIIGGESGPRARPCDLAWMRGVVEQCQGAGVQTFVKQLGRHPVEDGLRLSLNDKKGGAIAEFPADLRLREFPDAWRSGLDQSRCRGYCS